MSKSYIFLKFKGGVTRVTLVHVSHQMGVGAHLNNLAVVRYCVRQPQKMWQSLSQISNIVYLAQIILLRSLKKQKISVSNTAIFFVCLILTPITFIQLTVDSIYLYVNKWKVLGW